MNHTPTITAPTAGLLEVDPPAPASDNAILAISARAAALRAQGVDILSLAAGEPDTPTPAHITAAAAHAAVHENHHYGPAAGDLELRTAIAARLPVLPTSASTASAMIASSTTISSGPAFTAEDVQVTLGTKHALSLGVAAICAVNESGWDASIDGGGSIGGEVLLADPGWPGHTGAVLAAGAVPVAVPVNAATGFLATAADLEAARTERTRAVVLASPANPSGAVYSREQLHDIAHWALTHNVWVISDDVYEQIVYGAPAPHVLNLVPELREQCLIVGGVSKAYAMTGWRIGWLVGPSRPITRARRHVSRTITHVPHVTQVAAVAALTGDQACVRQALQTYRTNRDLLISVLRSIPGVDCPTPAGGMFVFPDVTGLLERGRWAGTVELADWLLEHAGVAVVPGEAFGAPGHLRMCFAISPGAASLAAQRLVQHLHAATPRAVVDGNPAEEVSS